MYSLHVLFSQIVAQLESSDLIVKTLQSQLSDLQKSETILKAKQHHEQVICDVNKLDSFFYQYTCKFDFKQTYQLDPDRGLFKKT